MVNGRAKGFATRIPPTHHGAPMARCPQLNIIMRNIIGKKKPLVWGLKRVFVGLVRHFPLH